MDRLSPSVSFLSAKSIERSPPLINPYFPCCRLPEPRFYESLLP